MSVPEARMLLIQPLDISIKRNRKGYFDVDLGLTPTNDGKCIRLVFPELQKKEERPC